MLRSTADERTIIFADYIIRTGCTVRSAAARFGVSKSTVHKYLTERLPLLDAARHTEVKAVLEHNKAQRHLRGGAATRQKYLQRRESAGNTVK
ncbi:MAG: stage III sporulation protein D [Ruminococcaceae bacterium]|nr:stage III sporulation protein D [Oscillospiraceae bacterium]